MGWEDKMMRGKEKYEEKRLNMGGEFSGRGGSED